MCVGNQEPMNRKLFVNVEKYTWNRRGNIFICMASYSNVVMKGCSREQREAEMRSEMSFLGMQCAFIEICLHDVNTQRQFETISFIMRLKEPSIRISLTPL